MARKTFFFILFINLVFVLFIVGAFIYVKKNKNASEDIVSDINGGKNVVGKEQKAQVNTQDYPFKNFLYTVQKDEYKGGYFLTGFIDGEILRDSILIPGTNLTSILAVRLYFINTNSKLGSLLVPIVAKDTDDKLVVLDLAAAKGFEQEGITQESEILKFFADKLENKKGKVLSVGIREANQTATDDDPLSSFWGDYYRQNESSYKALIETGDPSIGVLFIRAITSSLFKDTFTDVPTGI